MKREYTGYCNEERMYGKVPSNFNERKHSLLCPNGHVCLLSPGNLEETIKDLMLSKSEIFEQSLKVIPALEKE